MKKYIIGILLFVAICSSCEKSVKAIETDYIIKVVENVNINKNVKWIILLPGLGCTGCIQEAETFMKENITNKELFFVLTKIESLKILQNKINVNLKEYSNVYIDRTGKFNIPTDNTIYPCIIKLKEGKPILHEFQSPENGDAFQKLKERVLSGL